MTSFPKAIIHIDADAFFASCEQALHPDWKGKPVVTGKERGIALAVSYEAKKRGVVRGMTIPQVKKICPDAIIAPGNYEAYSLFSKRLFSIMRRFSGAVEEYGIDEGFIDLTGFHKPFKMSYPVLARHIQETIEKELNISVSVGLASTKVLAKIASAYNKPHGLQVIPMQKIFSFLKHIPVEKIWGVGRNTARYMHRLDIFSAYDFVQKSWTFVEKNFTKPHQEIWKELRGETVYSIMSEEKTTTASISRTRTFRETSRQKNIVYAELIKNLERACAQARAYQLAPARVSIFLKQQNFTIHALEGVLNRASNFPQDIITIIKPLFDKLFVDGANYRTTGVVLSGLQDQHTIQTNFFESPLHITRLEQVYSAIDALTVKMGHRPVKLACTVQPDKTEIVKRKNKELGWFGLKIPVLFGFAR